MPRITVTSDPRPGEDEPAVLLEETVQSVHLSTAHAAAQLVERLAWAVIDAERDAGGRSRHPVPAGETIDAHAAIPRARRLAA